MNVFVYKPPRTGEGAHYVRWQPTVGCSPLKRQWEFDCILKNRVRKGDPSSQPSHNCAVKTRSRTPPSDHTSWAQQHGFCCSDTHQSMGIWHCSCVLSLKSDLSTHSAQTEKLFYIHDWNRISNHLQICHFFVLWRTHIIQGDLKDTTKETRTIQWSKETTGSLVNQFCTCAKSSVRVWVSGRSLMCLE